MDHSIVDVQSTAPVHFSSISESTLARKSGAQEKNTVLITFMIAMIYGVMTKNMFFLPLGEEEARAVDPCPAQDNHCNYRPAKSNGQHD